MKYLQITIGIFLALAASRFIPHPPNFTSLIALSFYVPIFLGLIYLPALILCFVITDYFIGFHSAIFFTWGSILFISLISKYFASTIITRLSGAFIGAFLFFLITNFGVWTNGAYGYTLSGLISCYLLALPFFGNTLIATILYSTIIETIFRYSSIKKLI